LIAYMRHKLFTLSTYTAHFTTAIFFFGFAFDMVLLPDFDDLLAKLIGLTHITLIALFIIFREWIVSRNTASSFEEKIYAFSTFIIAFSSGSALSFVFVYALRSAAFSVSWPLFVMLFIVMCANEFFTSHSYRLTLDIAVLFIASFFYIVFNLPALLKEQNDIIFTISAVISVVVGLLYVTILRRSSETAEHEAGRGYALALGIPMFVSMLYVLNVIPAVPLSMKAGGVYHSVIRHENGEFFVEGETDTRPFVKYRRPIYHVSPQDTGAYFFSAVDAPAELSAPLSHVWEQYDYTSKKWVTGAVIPFALSGGRDGGYRAYTYKQGATEGLWRVTVKVDSKRIIGRKVFYIKRVDTVKTKGMVL
jgi:Protein of unknown function (DUF2914)